MRRSFRRHQRPHQRPHRLPRLHQVQDPRLLRRQRSQPTTGAAIGVPVGSVLAELPRAVPDNTLSDQRPCSRRPRRRRSAGGAQRGDMRRRAVGAARIDVGRSTSRSARSHASARSCSAPTFDAPTGRRADDADARARAESREDRLARSAADVPDGARRARLAADWPRDHGDRNAVRELRTRHVRLVDADGRTD
jgi:hypothetical protein